MLSPTLHRSHTLTPRAILRIAILIAVATMLASMWLRWMDASFTPALAVDGSALMAISTGLPSEAGREAPAADVEVVETSSIQVERIGNTDQIRVVFGPASPVSVASD